MCTLPYSCTLRAHFAHALVYSFPTALQVVEPKTSDGADFVRALRKHRELEDIEHQEGLNKDRLLQAKFQRTLKLIKDAIEEQKLGAKVGMLIPFPYDRFEHMLLKCLPTAATADEPLPLSECRTLFESCDVDGNGTCSLHEVLRGLTCHGNQELSSASAGQEENPLRVNFEVFANMPCNRGLGRAHLHYIFNLVANGGEGAEAGLLQAVSLTEDQHDI